MLFYCWAKEVKTRTRLLGRVMMYNLQYRFNSPIPGLCGQAAEARHEAPELSGYC
jgi:hypothetical protein